MEELYLIAYQCNNYMRIRSISLTGAQVGSMLRRVADIAHVIEKQTGDQRVEILAITPLHKLAEDAARTNLRDNSQDGPEVTDGKQRG